MIPSPWPRPFCLSELATECLSNQGQCGSVAFAVVVRLEEDAEDLRKRIRRRGDEEESGSDPVARLLHLKKAYPRVNKPALWGILKMYGLKGNFLWTLQDLHEATTYVVKGRGEDSGSWRPERGLREGCATSPTLFNVYHQAVMRKAEEAREAEALLNETPHEEEIERAVAKMKESAPGKDGVRVCYLKEAPPKVKAELVRMVKFMFENRAHKWEEELKTGQIVPLFKKEIGTTETTTEVYVCWQWEAGCWGK